MEKIQATTKTIDDNRLTIERSTQVISNNAAVIEQSTGGIKSNQMVIEASTVAIGKNQAVVEQSTAAIAKNAATLDEIVSASDKLKSNKPALAIIIVLAVALLFIPSLLLALVLWRMNKLMKIWLQKEKKN